MIWSLQIKLPEPRVTGNLSQQEEANLSRRESYTSQVVNMATKSVAQAAHHQKQQCSSQNRLSQSGRDSDDSLSSPEPVSISSNNIMVIFCILLIVGFSYQRLVKIVWKRGQQLR